MYDESAPIINERERPNRILTLQPPLQDEGLAYSIARLLAAEVNCAPRDQFETDTQYGQALAHHIANAFDELNGHSDIVVVLSPNNNLLATASLGRLWDDGYSAQVEGVAVVPEHRGEGLGRAAVDTVEDIARRRGVTHLEVIPSDATARDFYEHLGYGNPELPADETFYRFL